MSRLHNLNAYDRHKAIVNQYILTKPGNTKLLQRDTLSGKRDFDVIRENHKFLWDVDEGGRGAWGTLPIAESNSVSAGWRSSCQTKPLTVFMRSQALPLFSVWDEDEANSWEKRLAKKYYDKLFKEYCICDLSRFKENQIALRWRIEKEVISGKGQFVCGNKICPAEVDLRSWEVNFGYVEHGEKKNALVKLRLCPECSAKLNYHSKKREVKRMKKTGKQTERKRKHKKNAKVDMPGPSSSDKQSTDDTDQMEERCSSGEESQDNAKQTEMHDEGIWSRPVETEEMSREEEFEKYLEDLLL